MGANTFVVVSSEEGIILLYNPCILYSPIPYRQGQKIATKKADKPSPGKGFIISKPKGFTRKSRRATFQHLHLRGCQIYGPLLGTLSIRCRIIIEIQKGTIILTTMHLSISPREFLPSRKTQWDDQTFVTYIIGGPLTVSHFEKAHNASQVRQCKPY